MSVVIKVEDLGVCYGKKQVLSGVNIQFSKNTVTSLIGPSGCGKSTFLRCLNRMNDHIQDFSLDGKILLDGDDISTINTIYLRSRVGMVFQNPTPFPKSIYENVAYGPKIHNMYSSSKDLDEIVISSLEKAGLYKEVKSHLHDSALSLSGGQKQRLCIARALAINPEVILMDEPCASLDPIATSSIEELILSLKKKITIIIITHSLAQAGRISDYTAFFYLGSLIEFDETSKMLTNPKKEKTLNYITGRFET